MSLDADFMVVDFDSQALVFDNGVIVPFSELFGKDDEANDGKVKKFHFDFNIKQVYADALGKYSQIYGNVAFIDCSYIFPTFLKEINDEISFDRRHPWRYFIIKEALDRLAK